jgi:hypothetical protein
MCVDYLVGRYTLPCLKLLSHVIRGSISVLCYVMPQQSDLLGYTVFGINQIRLDYHNPD